MRGFDMRRFGKVAVATLSMALLVLAGLLVSGGSAGAHPALQGNEGASSCLAVRHKTASPPVILLGETVDITLTVTAICAGEQFPLHIVLVLDASGSMAGEPTAEMKKAARQLVKSLDMRNNPATKIGVVAFAGSATILCQLTDNASRASGCVGKVGASGGTSISAGILAGIRVLVTGRRALEVDAESIREVMVVLSDGADNAGCGPVQRAAGQASAQGILVISVCVGSGCDVQCMRSIATSPRYYFEARSASQLAGVFEQIRKGIQNIILKQMTVTDNLPPNMALVPDSAQPPPNTISDNLDQLVWQQSHVPKEGLTFTFKVRPLEVGYHKTNGCTGCTSGAYGSFKDNKDRTGTFDFTDPVVLVLNPSPLQTPTIPPPPPPTPTPTPTNTTGPTPTNTPTPTPTPTGKPGPIYLPVLLWERCVDDEHLADIALVIDMSTSMNRLSEDGVQKKVAVIDSAKAFVEGLDFTPNVRGQHDQVAVVWFNDNAGIAQELTGNKAAALRALDELPRHQAEGTRLDKAFLMGMQALPQAKRMLSNTPVMVMLTDGLPNRVPLDPVSGRQEETVINAARQAKDVGIIVYTIGFGRADAPDIVDRVLPELLRECASAPEKSFIAPTASEIGRIYSEIIDRFSCGTGRHDWGQPWPPERGRAVDPYP